MTKLLSLVSLTVLALAGCGPLISFGNGEPETVYTLTYPQQATPSDEGVLIFISEPSFSQGLGGRLISVRLTDNQRTTIKDVRWSTRMSALLRDFMVVGLRHRTKARTIGEDGLDVRTKCRLNSYLWAMDFLPDSVVDELGRQDQISISLELSLIDLEEGMLIARDLFSHKEAVDGTPVGITSGFETGMTAIMSATGRWLESYLDAC